MTLERLWAGWRSGYVADAAADDADHGDEGGCVFCRILASGAPDEETLILWRGSTCFAILNLYPYTSGHTIVMPYRHVARLADLDPDEGNELWQATTAASVALTAAYGPDGLNLGANLGRSAGAGIPGHLHLHCLPRWSGDTNFMTTVAESRVLPESLSDSWQRVRDSWPD